MRQPSVTIAIAILAVILGALSLWTSHGPARVAEFTPWLVAGLVCVGCGLSAARVARWSLEGMLLVAAGFLWLLPDVSTCLNVEPLSHQCVAVEPLAPVAAILGWLWIGAMGHAIITFGDGRVRTPAVLLATLATYALAVGMGAGPGPARPALAVLLIGAPLVGSMARGYLEGPEWIAAVAAGGALGTALLLDPTLPNALGVGLGVAAATMLAGVAAISRRTASITTDRAVELGAALASTLGDPSFAIAVRRPRGDGWLTVSGEPTPEPAAAGPATTTIVRDGEEIASLAHNAATLADPDVRAAVLTAVELEAHNTRLRSDLSDQAEAIAASRRRLVDAGLREREALGARVSADVLLHLDDVDARIELIAQAGLPPGVADRLLRAVTTIGTARREIADLIRGLYPPVLAEQGLAGALRELANAAPIEVRLDVPVETTPAAREAEATLYFVCAEAIANAVRHAHASSVRVSMKARSDVISVEIEDDGTGGADLESGSGLRGLRDRVEALGGTLRLDSPPGVGTRLVATVPVGRVAR